MLALTIGANGEVAEVEVVTSVDPALDAAAMAAVKRWRFKPAMACGKAGRGRHATSSRARFELGRLTG